MILYVFPKHISKHFSEPSAVPVVVELSNRHGDNVLFTVHDWICGAAGQMVVIAKLSGAGLDSNQHTYYSVIIDIDDLIEHISHWSIRCIDATVEGAERDEENGEPLAETEDV